MWLPSLVSSVETCQLLACCIRWSTVRTCSVGHEDLVSSLGVTRVWASWVVVPEISCRVFHRSRSFGPWTVDRVRKQSLEEGWFCSGIEKERARGCAYLVQKMKNNDVTLVTGRQLM